MITKSLLSFFAVLVFTATCYSQNFKSVKISGEQHHSIIHKLYNAVEAGKITAYEQDLRTKVAPDKLAKKTELEEIISIYPDPNDPYKYYDTVIVSSFDARNVRGLVIHSENAAFFSPYYTIYNADGETNKPLFWIKREDAKKVLTKDEYEQLINLLEKAE
jgi:mitochondrial fission protein ELM1